MDTLASSAALLWQRVPPKAPMGVRHADTMTTSFMIFSFCYNLMSKLKIEGDDIPDFILKKL
jgi:hypothetical protein